MENNQTNGSLGEGRDEFYEEVIRSMEDRYGIRKRFRKEKMLKSI